MAAIPQIIIVDTSGDRFPPGSIVMLSIMAAIHYAGDGDTIHLFPGVYRENVTLTKPLTIIGKGDRSEIRIEGFGTFAHFRGSAKEVPRRLC